MKFKMAILALRAIKRDPQVKGTQFETTVQNWIDNLKNKAQNRIADIWPNG